MKYIYMILIMIVILFTGCNYKIINENNSLTSTKINDTATNTKSKMTQHSSTVNDNENIELQKRLAVVYEDYFNNKSKKIAIKADSFSLYQNTVIATQKMYELFGHSENEAKQMAIDDLIKREVNYCCAVNYDVKVTEKELDDYIKQQMEMARNDDRAYLYYLKNITIEEVYQLERENIKKELAIEKYFNFLEKEYGEAKAKKEYNKAYEKTKKSQNIEVLI